MFTPIRPGPFDTRTLRKRGQKTDAISFPTGRYIRANDLYCTTDEVVPAPYFRKRFTVKPGLKSATLLINGLGHYELHCNGVDISNGPLASYRANPDHIVFFDRYCVTDSLQEGENVLAFLLGNGLQNASFPRHRWQQLPWREAVKLAFRLRLEYENGEIVNEYSDTNMRTAPSPILFNDYHLGEHYDARLEIPGWSSLDFDDSQWAFAQPAPTPRGEAMLSEAEPIGRFEELTPVEIFPYEEGYIYDFGVNHAGVCRLNIEGQAGQKLILQHFERIVNGRIFWDRIACANANIQQDIYICSGKGKEQWHPRFTYHGFRYVYVQGITPQQATPELLTYVVMHSDLPDVGSFSCDNEMVNLLQQATVRSDWSNFVFFPTDCPHREKHGWTGDAVLSAEQMLYNFDPTDSWRQWLLCIHRAMSPVGGLPGIIPTSGINYDWGNGPAWDAVMTELPYQAYRYRGNRRIVEEAVVPLMRYLTYLTTRRQENGLICFGLGDWCDVDAEELFCNTPVIVTDSIISVDIARKCAHLFEVAGRDTFRRFAQEFADSLTADIRRELMDPENFRIYGDTQTTQAMAMYYGIFTPEEFPGAMEHLLELIEEKDGHFATGVLGGRVLFRVLAENGYAELALSMIIREDHPSYGNLILRGATTLWEEFDASDPPRGDDNHHFWGDISAWFYRYLGGIRPNPDATDVNRLDIIPCFVSQVNSVEAAYRMPAGLVQVSWKRTGDQLQLKLQVPDEAIGNILLTDGWQFADGSCEKPLLSGCYTLSKP